MFVCCAPLVKMALFRKKLEALLPDDPSGGLNRLARLKAPEPKPLALGARSQNITTEVLLSFVARDAITARNSFFSLKRITKPSVV